MCFFVCVFFCVCVVVVVVVCVCVCVAAMLGLLHDVEAIHCLCSLLIASENLFWSMSDAVKLHIGFLKLLTAKQQIH